MPSKDEKERLKLLQKEFKLKAKREFENNLPMSREVFISLFDHLDEKLSKNICNHNFELTNIFLKSEELVNVEKLTNWLKINGAYCDCEILSNIEEKFEDDAIL